MTTKININSSTDEELMQTFIQHHNENAFGHLYQKYFQMLCKYLGWLANDVEKGKDLTQNIFLKIYNQPHLFDTQRNFKVWLFSIAKNHWKNELRNEATRNKHHQQFALLPTFNISENQNNELRLQQLKAALEQLSENHKEVFILKYSNNLSIQEISEICNCSVGTVKSRLFYALQKLKNKLRR